MRKFKIIILTGTFLLPLLVSATATSLGDLVTIIRGIFNSSVGLLITAALVVFFWGLIKYLIASGDAAKAVDGKELMVWGIIALFVMISVWGLVNLIVFTFGIDNTSASKPSASSIVPSGL